MKKVVFILALTTINFLHAADTIGNPEEEVPHLGSGKKRKIVARLDPSNPTQIFVQAVPAVSAAMPLHQQVLPQQVLPQQVLAQQIFQLQQVQNLFAGWTTQEKMQWTTKQSIALSQLNLALTTQASSLQQQYENLNQRYQQQLNYSNDLQQRYDQLANQAKVLVSTVNRLRAERNALREQVQKLNPPSQQESKK